MPPLLRGDARGPVRSARSARRRPDRLCDLSRSAREAAATLGGARVQRPALDVHALGRPFRGDGKAPRAGRGHPGVLPTAARTLSPCSPSLDRQSRPQNRERSARWHTRDSQPIARGEGGCDSLADAAPRASDDRRLVGHAIQQCAERSAITRRPASKSSTLI